MSIEIPEDLLNKRVEVREIIQQAFKAKGQDYNGDVFSEVDVILPKYIN